MIKLDRKLYNQLIEARQITLICIKRDKEIVKLISKVIRTKKLNNSDFKRLEKLFKQKPNEIS